MEQILNKLSEIELTAQRIMEDCDRQSNSFLKRQNRNVKIMTSSWRPGQQSRFDGSVSNWKKKKIPAWHSYVQIQTLPFLHWMLITNSSTHNFPENCLRKYWLCKDLSQTLNDIRKGSEKQWEAYSPTADFPRKSAQCRAGLLPWSSSRKSSSSPMSRR